MMMLLTLSFLWTLPLALVVLSWIGAKLGARAPLLLFLPFPLLIAHTSRYVTGGLDAVTEAASTTMDSVPMAFSWAIPYFYLSAVLDRRLANRTLASALSVAASIAIAFVVQRLYEPLWGFIDGTVMQLLVVLAVVLGSALVLRLPRAERTVLSAVPTPMSLVGRVMGILLIIFGLVWGVTLPAPWGVALLAVLHSFPRLTFELAISTHLTNGVAASRQLLSGLPVAVTMAIVWCYGVLLLAGRVPDAAVLPLAGGLAVAWWAVIAVVYLKTFGVFRRENGFF